MSENTQIAQRDDNAVARPQASEERRRVALNPAVDIFEDAHAITLLADLPGVPKNRLDLQVHDGSLTIEAESVVPVQPDLTLIHAEIRAPYFARRFTVSEDFDTSKIDATLKDGVLKLTIPRRDEAKPRRVEVRVG
jgi:HSP20 family protein